MKPKIFVIDGPIGAGKSTLINVLRKKYTCYEEPISDWGTLLGEFYNDMNTYAYPFQFQVLLSQKKQYDIIKKGKSDFCFVERSPHNSKFIFFDMLKHNNVITDEEECVYNKHYKNLSYDPDHYFILNLPVDMAYERIKLRNRKEEQSISKDYLTQLHKKYEDVYSNKNNVTIIDATKNPYEIFAQINKELADLV